MKKYSLSHETFNGQVGAVSRRTVLLTLMENRYRFETKLERWFHKGYKLLIGGGIILLVILSLMAIQRWHVWDLAERSTISSIYHGSKAEVEANKAKAYQKLEIAGASGEGRRQ